MGVGDFLGEPPREIIYVIYHVHYDSRREGVSNLFSLRSTLWLKLR